MLKNDSGLVVTFFVNSSFLLQNYLDGYREYLNCIVHRRNLDRKSTRMNSSHVAISYAVFCSHSSAISHPHSLSLHDSLPISIITAFLPFSLLFIVSMY